MRIRHGAKYRVSKGSGLDSGRIGIALHPTGLLQLVVRKMNPGYYRNFDGEREAILVDALGSYFTMFKNRLEVVNDEAVTFERSGQELRQDPS